MLSIDRYYSDVVYEYAEFISTLTWYRMYCVSNQGNGKKDYVEGFENLNNVYIRIKFDDDNFPIWLDKTVNGLFQEIREILNSGRLTDTKIERIGKLLWDFENNQERQFRRGYIKYTQKADAIMYHSEELYEAVADLLETDKSDAAVLAAFKYLERHLQNILGVSPHQYIGEDLINYAFSPKKGVLQLGTHPNEQAGLRNIFSGAYALFRNPSAHRFIIYDEFTARTIIAMVAMLAQLATKIASEHQKESP